MFKVICIDDAERPDGVRTPSGWRVKEGETYTVMDDYIYQDHVSYALFEDPDNDGYGWNSNRFIPLSNIDEMELIEKEVGTCSFI